MPRQTINLGSYALNTGFGGDIPVLLDPDFVVGGATAYLVYLEISGGQVTLRTHGSAGGGGGGSGPQLTDLWEEHAEAVVLRNLTEGTSITIAGPTHSSSFVSDTNEPYEWLPSNFNPLSNSLGVAAVGDQFEVDLFDGFAAPDVDLEGQLDSAGTISADLTLIQSTLFEGQLDGTGELSSILAIVQPTNLQGQLAGSGELSGVLVVAQPTNLQGQLVGSGELSGIIQYIQPTNLQGQLDGAGTVDLGEFGLYILQSLKGRLDAVGELSGTLRLEGYKGQLDATADMQGLLQIQNPIRLISQPDLLVPEFPFENAASVPVMHVGERVRGDFSTRIDFESMFSDGGTVYVYFNKLKTTPGTFVTVAGKSVGYQSATSIRVDGNVVNLNLHIGNSFIFVVEQMATAYCLSVYNGETGQLISLRQLSGNAGSVIVTDFDVDDEDITRVVYEDGAGSSRSWYSSAPGFLYNTAAIIPISARITRGRDSQRQLTPPRVPAMTCEVWDRDASIYQSRPYDSGTAVSLLAILPHGENELMFTGLVDTVGYKFKEQVFTYTVNGLGMTSQLVRDKLYGDILIEGSISDCLVETLKTADWLPDTDVVGVYDTDDLDLNPAQFSTVLSYWWLAGQTAWATIHRLVNTEGPPSTFYEDNTGRLVFLGTGQTGNPLDQQQIVGFTRDEIELYRGNASLPGLTGTEISSASAIADTIVPIVGDVREKSETEYVVNHAEMDIIEYMEPEDDSNIWSRGTEFRILPGAMYTLTATFTGPVIEYANTDEPDFMSTVETLMVSYSELTATRAIMVFDNSGSTQVARVRNLSIQGKALEIVARIQVSSDGIELTVPTVQKSLDDHGVREWPANVYNTITVDRGQQLVRNIVQNYHEGVDTFVLKLFGTTIGKLKALLRFTEPLSVRNPYVDRTGQPVDFRELSSETAYIRKIQHIWERGFSFSLIEVESRSGDFYGVQPFIIGSSFTNTGKGYSA